MDKRKALRQRQLKYPSDLSSQKTPSFLERIRSALSPSIESAYDPPRERLINGWQDVTGENINIVICNFLYDEKSEQNERWKRLEKFSGVRREYFFYGMCFIIFIATLCQDPLTVVHSLVVLIWPAMCTMWVLNDARVEAGARFWLQYWIVYAIITSLGRAFKRSSEDSNDLSWMEIIFFTACLIPATYLSDFVLACILPIFNKIRTKFDEYNYHYVS
ncbi:hypothetical protein GCK32_013105 [Trichostrongylus colubriformis]|uniref:Receptor expression-enhancing protein n=1 Tax=Trichostrongylus colubriformis TaxID=6319 RepID=A0AAN8F7B6_TRICO